MATFDVGSLLPPHPGREIVFKASTQAAQILPKHVGPKSSSRERTDTVKKVLAGLREQDTPEGPKESPRSAHCKSGPEFFILCCFFSIIPFFAQKYSDTEGHQMCVHLPPADDQGCNYILNCTQLAH